MSQQTQIVFVQIGGALLLLDAGGVVFGIVASFVHQNRRDLFVQGIGFGRFALELQRARMKSAHHGGARRVFAGLLQNALVHLLRHGQGFIAFANFLHGHDPI